MSTEPTIRAFQSADEPQVTELWQTVFAYPTAHNQPQLAIQRKLAFQPELFFVALEGARVVGTVMGGYDGHRGWIYSMAVRPDRRRSGIGSALVRHLESVFRGLDCPKVNLQILEDNAEVAAFYERLGYHVEPRISMGKIL